MKRFRGTIVLGTVHYSTFTFILSMIVNHEAAQQLTHGTKAIIILLIHTFLMIRLAGL
jgi:hypothetical protein